MIRKVLKNRSNEIRIRRKIPVHGLMPNLIKNYVTVFNAYIHRKIGWIKVQSLKENSCFLRVVNHNLSIHNQLFYKYIVLVLFQMHLSRTQWDKVSTVIWFVVAWYVVKSPVGALDYRSTNKFSLLDSWSKSYKAKQCWPYIS